MLSEAMVRHVLGSEGAEALIGIIQGAWDDFRGEGIRRMHRTTRANIVWDYMAQRSEVAFAAADGVTAVWVEERPIYVVRDCFAMRPKMHSRDILTRNYPTATQQRVDQTGLLGDLEVPLVAFGYVLDAAEAGIEQCVITPSGDDWVIDLDDLAAGTIAPVKAMLDYPNIDEPWRRVDPIRLHRGE